MAELEADRNKLEEELETLNQEMGELVDARKEAERIRAEEKAENANTVKEAQAGLDALDSLLYAGIGFVSVMTHACPSNTLVFLGGPPAFLGVALVIP